MKMFFAVFFAIFAAVGVIYVIYARQQVEERRERIKDWLLQRYIPPFSLPLPPAQAKTLRGNLAVVIVQAVRVNTPRGEVIVPRGTRLRLISETADHFLVDYDGYSVPVPLVRQLGIANEARSSSQRERDVVASLLRRRRGRNRRRRLTRLI